MCINTVSCKSVSCNYSKIQYLCQLIHRQCPHSVKHMPGAFCMQWIYIDLIRTILRDKRNTTFSIHSLEYLYIKQLLLSFNIGYCWVSVWIHAHNGSGIQWPLSSRVTYIIFHNTNPLKMLGRLFHSSGQIYINII